MKISDQSGFSLIEVLIAIFLLAIMMVSIVSITNTGIDTKEKILSEDSEVTQVETALVRLSEDIYQIYSPLYFSSKESGRKKRFNEGDRGPKIKFTPSERFPGVTSKGQPIPLIDSPDRQTLIFFSNSNLRKTTGVKQSNYAWIKYTLRNMEGERNPDAPYELIRYFDPNNIYGRDFVFDEIKAQVLMKNIKSLEFSFWDPDRKKFVDTIREIVSDKKLIMGVEIKLTWIDQTGLERVTKRILDIQWPNIKPPSPDEDEPVEEEGQSPEEPVSENQFEE